MKVACIEEAKTELALEPAPSDQARVSAAGYGIESGDVTQPGQPWPTLTLQEVMASHFQ